ncbi:thioredoxin-like protein [Mycena capillaripes]|nr:thioredoxin-like protein [Mycena capillaripes]
MAIIKVYGAEASPATRRVATVLHELRVPIKLIKVDMGGGEHKSSAFMKKQPFGQIPYIDDNGFILYESRAICRYMAAKHPASGLIPAEPKANALFEQAAAVEFTHFELSASILGGEMWKLKFLEMAPDQALMDTQLEILDKEFDAYDAILAKQRYVAGDKVTGADLFYLPFAVLIGHAGSDIMTRKSAQYQIEQRQAGVGQYYWR